jgi:colanic acid/amylovoran biosynthesis glycosyltransferase
VKIAFVVGGFPKLSETWILAQIAGLLQRGHEVEIYSRRNPREAGVHPEVAEYGLLEHTHYFDLPTSRFGRALRTFKALAATLPRHPYAVLRCLNLPRYRTLYAVLNNVMFTAPFLERPYDAVLCHFGGNAMDFIVLKDVFPRMRFVTMFHGDDYFIGDEKGPDAFTLLKRLGDAFLVTTDCFGRETLRRYGFDERRIVTLRLSIDAKRIPFRERSLDGDTLRILSVGRLVSKKGFEFGVRAVAALQAANPQLHVEYHIIGDGPSRGELSALVRSLGADSTVQFLGPLHGTDVMRWMHESHIYLLPSVMEQAGYVLLEAQASGLPIVATRVGGVPEMVREDESALLAEPSDPRSITEALQRLVDRQAGWPAMGRAGRRHVEEQFDTSRLTSLLEGVLRA